MAYSHHNFAYAGWNRGDNAKPGQICGPCHIPHVESRPMDRTLVPLLWGRKLSAATYVMYSSPTIQGETDPQPTGTSRLCLGCHDGTIAMQLFHTSTTGNAVFPRWHRQVVPGRPGFDFGSDHPISIKYSTQDPDLRPTDAPFGIMPGKTIADVLEGDKVQCVTCHDIHNRDVPASGGSFYLRMTVRDPAAPSAICKACHVK